MERHKLLGTNALARHRLTIEHMLRHDCDRLQPNKSGSGFSVIMRNDVRRSLPRDPSTAVASGGLEIIRVGLEGNILSIATIDSARKPTPGRKTVAPREVRLATRSVSILGATVFTLLRKRPTGRRDGPFVPASGSVVLFDPDDDGQRAIRACGVDEVPGDPSGWIFDAIEV